MMKARWKPLPREECRFCRSWSWPPSSQLGSLDCRQEQTPISLVKIPINIIYQSIQVCFVWCWYWLWFIVGPWVGFLEGSILWGEGNQNYHELDFSFWECPMATLLRIVDCRQEQCVGDRCSWCLTPSMAWSDSWYWHIIKWAKKRDSHHHWSSPNCFNYFLASTQEADSLLRQILQRSRGRQTSSLLPLVWAIKKIKTTTMAMTLTVTMIIGWCHLVRVHSSTSLALHQWKQPVESKVICTSGYLCYLSRLWWLGWF